MAAEVKAFIDNGALNSENFFIEDASAVSAEKTRVSVGAAFEFDVFHASPFPIKVVGRASSKALKLFQTRLDAAARPSITVALQLATKEYLKIADDLDEENADDDDGGAAAAAGSDDNFDQAAREGEMLKRQEEARKQMELEAAFNRIKAQYDVSALPKPAVDRITSDYANMQKTKHHGWTAAPIGRNLHLWSIDMFDFEKGTALHRDMEQVKARTGKAAVELLMTFPPEYPFKPPFIRVVRPRFQFRTGHVTVGGSICTQLLTEEGWKPIYDIESMMETIRQQITDTESGAKIDHANTSDYTEQEAKEAFTRVAEYHRQHGW